MLFWALALAPAVAQPPGAEALLPYMAQTACLDAAGQAQLGRLPFEPGCTTRRPLHAGDPLPWRKHDWPARHHAAASPHGYQASDSLLGRLRGTPAILQSLDFGDTRRAFGRYDRGLGDGGQAVVLRGADAALLLTEDGSGGRQWLLGQDCQAGWLLAAAPLGEAWQERLVHLRIAAAPEACPRAFDASLTRWRQLRLDLPWREADSGATATTTADTLVSEHYGGASIATAHHLERFWFARDLGLVRWERWENPARSQRPGLAAMAALIAGSGRCPAIAASVPPAAGWALLDCRLWTNFVRATAEAPLAAPDWPGALP